MSEPTATQTPWSLTVPAPNRWTWRIHLKNGWTAIVLDDSQEKGPGPTYYKVAAINGTSMVGGKTTHETFSAAKIAALLLASAGKAAAA